MQTPGFFLTHAAGTRIQACEGLQAAAPRPSQLDCKETRDEEKSQERRHEKGREKEI